MAEIDRELAAAKAAGVTVEQIRAITNEAIRKQNEPYEYNGFWEPSWDNSVYFCTKCSASFGFGGLNTGRKETAVYHMKKHLEFHNDVESRLRRLEKANQ